MKRFLDPGCGGSPLRTLRNSAFALLGLATAVGFTASEAEAITITFDDSFDFVAPNGIAVNPATGTLFIADSGADTITEVTTNGAFVSSFNFGGLDFTVKGLDFLPNGNLLLSDQSSNNSLGAPSLLEFTTAGAAVPAGINFVIDPPSADADGVAFNSFTGTIFVTDDIDETIYEFSTAGALLSQFDTEAIVTGFDEPEGITADPVTGNLLVVDDSGGTSSLYELTPTGALVQPPVDLAALTGFNDPEGITIHNNTLFIAFDSNEKVGQFSIDVPDAIDVPEPASLALFGAGLAGVGLAAWRRRKAKALKP